MIIDVDRLPQDGLQICKDLEDLSAVIIEEESAKTLRFSAQRL